MKRLFFLSLVVFEILNQGFLTGKAASITGTVLPLMSSFSPSFEVPQSGYPLWTPCKDCRHVWYLVCRSVGRNGCVVDGKLVPYPEFVKRANKKAKVISVERLENGNVVVWFKW